MLARTFKSAKELHISEIERQAAIEVLGLLERGDLQYWPIRFCKSDSVPDDAFNIGCWALCMGGQMEVVKGRALSMRCQKQWADLFEPEGFITHLASFTP